MPKSDSVPSTETLLRALPSVDQLLRTSEATAIRQSVGAATLTRLARAVTEELRREILMESQLLDGLAVATTPARELLLSEASRRLQAAGDRERRGTLARVINATGVVIHTNLGRAPLSQAARDALVEAAGYCNLEYDLTEGTRGRRGARVEELLIELSGAEAALIVNNCAAAALMILSVMAADGETIVSRGELVEIGGDFRVPDVMACSGTRMIEVGTTNRTNLQDYQRAINARTRLIMRVHQSNYRIVGFTAAPSTAELAALAHDAGLPFYEDAGSGVLQDPGAAGLSHEPLIGQSIEHGVDLISFSGDKLLGASQAGLVVGRGELVERLRKSPFYRALRADKLSLAVLEATLEAHRRGAANSEVPVLRMLALSQAEIAERAARLMAEFARRSCASDLNFELVAGTSAVGGGAGPDVRPATTLVSLSHSQLSSQNLEQALRSFNPPIICRISESRVLLDLRTIQPAEEADVLDALMQFSSK